MQNVFSILGFGVAPKFIPGFRFGVAPRSISTLRENTHTDKLFPFGPISSSLKLFGTSQNNLKMQPGFGASSFALKIHS